MAQPIISDHAVLRYLERVKGIDVESIRREMDSPALRAAVDMGATSVKLGCGARLRLKGDTVVTVLANWMRNRKND